MAGRRGSQELGEIQMDLEEIEAGWTRLRYAADAWTTLDPARVKGSLKDQYLRRGGALMDKRSLS